MAAIEPIPIPKPKPSFATTPTKPALKSADAAPLPRKVALASVKPRPNVAKPASPPAADEELPVTAPDSIKAFRAAQAAASALPSDSTGTSAP
jgi:hypothetical protein